MPPPKAAGTVNPDEDYTNSTEKVNQIKVAIP